MTSGVCRLTAWLALATGLVSCNLLNVDGVLGSTYVKTLPLAAGEPGSLEVTAADSRELAGTRLVVRAGTTAQPTTITLALQRRSLAAPPHTGLGPVAVFGPGDLELKQDVEVTLPMKLDATAGLQDLYVEGLESTEAGARESRGTSLNADPAAGTVTFSVSHLGRFQVVARGCDPTTPCDPGETCSADGRCRHTCGGAVCAVGETCVEARCVPGCPSSCELPESSCQTGYCDLISLTCASRPKQQGTVCNDGLSCTIHDQCDGQGACIGESTCSPHQHCDANDGCSCDDGHLDCDRASSNGCEFSGGACPCSDADALAVCARARRECGPFTGLDSSGGTCAAQCGDCPAQCPTCDPELGQCGPNCCPETDERFCLRQAKTCGDVVAEDNCGSVRTVNCGSCAGAQVYCDLATNTCQSCNETDEQLCASYGAECGSLRAVDQCGNTRIVASCGECVDGAVCSTRHACGGRPVGDQCTGYSTVNFTNPTSHVYATIETALDDAAGTCGGVGGGDLVMRLLMPSSAATLQIQVDDMGSVQWDPLIYLRTDCADASTELPGGCVAGSNGSASLTTSVAGGETLFLWIDAVQPGQGDQFKATLTVN